MSEQLPTDAGWWAAALTGIPLVGAGIRWIWSARQRRQDDFYQRNKLWATELAARERKIDEQLELQSKQCEDDLRKVSGEMERVKRLAERACLGIVLLAHETHSANPQSVALAQVKTLLAGAVPLDFETPPDIAALLARIDGD